MVVASPLRDLVPQDHLLRRVDGVLDLSWLHEAVRERYCQDNGRPSIDPESALRLMLAGFFEGIVHDRKLMRLSLRRPPPGGKTPTRKGYDETAAGWRYSARAHDCTNCAVRNRCFTATAKSRIIIIKDGHEALFRARGGESTTLPSKSSSRPR